MFKTGSTLWIDMLSANNSPLPYLKRIWKTNFYKIYYFFERKSPYNQCGFRNGQSATLQLITFLDHFFKYNDLEATGELNLLYVVFVKTLDTVSHVVLLEILKFLGIGGSIWGIVKSYLLNRKQFVQINGQKSSLNNDTSGVTQVFNIGPCLFLLFINDLPEMMQDVVGYGYVDDFKAIACNQSDLNKATEMAWD